MWGQGKDVDLLCGCAKSLQSCLTLCDPMDCRPPDSSVHGILQARILEWGTMPSSRASSQPKDWTHVSMSSALAGGFFIACATWEAPHILLAADAAKLLQSCPTVFDPYTIALQGPPSLGFSRQEHWSGLPFPSPMHENEKVRVKSLSRVRLFVTPWTAAY